MKKKTVYIPSISCNHCINAIRTEVLEINGVTGVKGDPSTKKVTFEWKPPTTWEDIESVLEEIGYPPR